MIDERDHELIERYLLDEATADERKAVELRLSGDPDFREAVEDMRQVIEAVHAHQGVELRSMFRQWDKEQENRPEGIPTPSGKRRWWLAIWIGFAGLILVTAILWRECRMRESSPSQQLQPVSPEEKPDSPKPTFDPAQPRQQQVDPASPGMARPGPDKRIAKPGDQQLFAEYYTPHKDALLNPEVRGTGPDDRLYSFRLAYWNGDYAGAVTLFESFSPDLQVSENDRFCYAGALLATDRAAEAIPVFEAIIERNKTLYVPESIYGLAMARLKEGEREASIALLKRYVAEPGAKDVGRAEEFLKHLE